MAAVAILSAAANITGNGVLLTNIGYLVFGLFWLLSCLTKEPLCAAYVKYNYGGESAHRNPLFMKTNYILAAAWGVLYVLTAIWTFLLKKAGLGSVLILVNNLIPVLMGLFTAWFQKMVSCTDGKRQEKIVFSLAPSQISSSTTSAASLFSALTEIYIFNFGSVHAQQLHNRASSSIKWSIRTVLEIDARRTIP